MDEPTDSLINKLQNKLEVLPEKPRNSKRATINQLLPVIRQARDRGYSYEEIADLLAEEGFDIAPKTLKTYCGASGRKKAKAQPPLNGTSPRLALPRTNQ